MDSAELLVQTPVSVQAPRQLIQRAQLSFWVAEGRYFRGHGYTTAIHVMQFVPVIFCDFSVAPASNYSQ